MEHGHETFMRCRRRNIALSVGLIGHAEKGVAVVLSEGRGRCLD
jgi:hypothetical protein